MAEEFKDPIVVDATLVVDSESRKWGMLCHLSSLIGFIIPLGSIIAPLIVWQMKKDVSLFVDEQGKEIVNFQISMSIWILISFVLVFLLIGFLLLGVLAILELVCVIMAGIQANEGKSFKYPMTIRFIK
jgi:uncharacterized Tic20 family protein